MILLNKVRSSFSAKVIVWVLLIAIPLFLLSVGLLYWQSRKLIRAEAEERANSVLKTAMQRINRYIITAETATNTYAWLDMPGDRFLASTNKHQRRMPGTCPLAERWLPQAWLVHAYHLQRHRCRRPS